MDNRLIEQARKLGHHRTKTEAVTAALNEYIRRHEEPEILFLFGRMDYAGHYDYKRERAKRP